MKRSLPVGSPIPLMTVALETWRGSGGKQEVTTRQTPSLGPRWTSCVRRSWASLCQIPWSTTCFITERSRSVVQGRRASLPGGPPEQVHWARRGSSLQLVCPWLSSRALPPQSDFREHSPQVKNVFSEGRESAGGGSDFPLLRNHWGLCVEAAGRLFLTRDTLHQKGKLKLKSTCVAYKMWDRKHKFLTV